MTEFDKEEIIRDNRVARLLWFALGFILASICFTVFSKIN